MAPSKRQHAQHAADRHHHHHPAGRHHSRAPSHKRHPDEPRPRPRAIKLGDVVEVATKHHGFQLALVRRVGADKAHIHWARRSEMVSPDHVVLRHSACRDVSRRSIVRRVHKTARWVFDRAQLAWRDAKQHGCDACAAKAAVSVAREATHVGDLVFLASPTGVYDLALRSNLPSTIRYTGRGPSVKVRRLGRVAELRGVTGHVSEVSRTSSGGVHADTIAAPVPHRRGGACTRLNRCRAGRTQCPRPRRVVQLFRAAAAWAGARQPPHRCRADRVARLRALPCKA